MQRPAKPCTSVRFRAQPPSSSPRWSIPSSLPPLEPPRPRCLAKTLPLRRPGGEIGRRKGLKIPRLRPCGFEPRPGHQPRTAIRGPDSLDLDTLFKAAGQVETTLGIAAETLLGPKPGTKPMPSHWRPTQPEMPDLLGSAPPSGTRQVGNAPVVMLRQD